MIYNEMLQWLLLGLILYRVWKHERTLTNMVVCFKVLNDLLQAIKNGVENGDDEQD